MIRFIHTPYALIAAALAALALLAAAGAGGYQARGVIADRDIATLKATHALALAQHAQALTDQAQQAQAAEAQQRIVQTRITTALQEASNVAYKRTNARAVAARRAAVGGGGLRIDAANFAAFTNSTESNSYATNLSEAIQRATLLANVLGSVEFEGRGMAEVADEARDAGHACQASYDALTP
jgi:hypothetical protein